MFKYVTNCHDTGVFEFCIILWNKHLISHGLCRQVGILVLSLSLFLKRFSINLTTGVYINLSI